MRFACDSCGAQYMIADEKVGARGVKVKCKKCGNMIVVKPAVEAAAAAPAAVAAASSSSSGSSASAGTSSFDFGAQTAVMPQAQQNELLGGSFSSMFASSTPAPEAPAPAPEPAASNGSYSNGNHAPEGESNDGGGGAFGFQSSLTHHGGETDMALGSLEQAQAPAGADRDGERVWYVAIEDAQVGPVNLAEVEQRWDNKEIDEDSLVWKAGMADWIPLVDVPELAYLITERPQAARGVARVGATAAAGSSMGMQSAYGAGGQQEIPDEPSWRPSAASALSSLVQEELVAKKPDAPEPSSTPKGMEGLGIPNLGASDIFGSGSGSGTPITMGQPTPAVAPAAADAFSSGGSPAWSVPSSRHHHGSGMGTKIVVGLLAVAVLGLGGFMVYMLQHQQPQVVVKEVVKEVAPPAPTQPQVDPNAPPVAPPLPPQQERTTVAKAKAPEKSSDRGRDNDSPKEKPRTKAKVSDDPLDQIDNAAKAPPPAAVKEALSKDDIIEGVKANGSKLGPCVTAARGKDEIQPGRAQFVLDWTINPNGSVTAARLKGPPEVMNTSLPSCFARVMGSWKFAASKSGAPITNFPLPITVR